MSVYPPREDSVFLKNFLEGRRLEGEKVLEMGTGSGFLALFMAGKGADVTAVDINPEAVEETGRKAREQGIELDVFRSDLFEEVEGEFDLIVFNPPYLPGENYKGAEKWRGGEKGTEVTGKFLEEAGEYLCEGGEALLVLSSLSDYRELVEEFDLELREKKKLWFETIFIAVYSQFF